MIEHRIVVNAPASVIFNIYQDVECWNTWDPDTKSSSLDGAFAVGTRGSLAPSKGRPIGITLTEVRADRAFTVVGGIPGFQMTFEHELLPNPSGTEVVHRVKFAGVLAFLFKPLLARQINAGLPVTLQRLKEHAEHLART
jgi:Polyketide cyclase / dehydrase and lipid transport